MEGKKGTLFEHLKELRRTIIISFLAFFGGMLLCYFIFREPIMKIVFDPIRAVGKDVVIIGVAEGFMIQLKLAAIGGIILASPVILWQIVWFVLPALYRNEKKLFFVYFFISLILFVAGIVLGYLFVLKIGLHAFLIDYDRGFETMISASKYLSFYLCFLLPFGLIFQIPLLTFFLSRLGIVTPRFLKHSRGYAVLLILVIAAVITPPDVLSQIMLALPMLLLYEISIMIAVLDDKRRIRKREACTNET